MNERKPLAPGEPLGAAGKSPQADVGLALCTINIQDDHIDMVDDRIDIPYPISRIHIPY